MFFLFFQAPIFVNGFVFQAVFFFQAPSLSAFVVHKIKPFLGGARLLRVQLPPNRLGEEA